MYRYNHSQNPFPSRFPCASLSENPCLNTQPPATTHLSFVTVQFSSVQLLRCVRLFVIPRKRPHSHGECQASLSINNSQSLPKPMFIKSVMPSNHLILCHPFLLLPSIFPSIRVSSSESALCIRWPKYWSFSFNISPSNQHPGLISFRMDWSELLAVQGTLKSLLRVEREVGGGIGMENTCKSMADSCQCMTKTTTIL